jgi:hypothetical protein
MSPPYSGGPWFLRAYKMMSRFVLVFPPLVLAHRQPAYVTFHSASLMANSCFPPVGAFVRPPTPTVPLFGI